MAANKRSGCTIALLVAVGVSALSGLVCCGGGVAALMMGPQAFEWMIVEDQPLAVAMPPADPAVAEAARARFCGDLWAVRTTRLTGAELTQLALDDAIPAAVFLVGIDGGALTLDVSAELEPGSGDWLNLHGKGGFTMEHGWFTDATIGEMTVSGWDLAGYVAGQQLAPDMNRSLANERAKRPEIGVLLDAYDSIRVADGALELTPNAAAAPLISPCAAYAPAQGSEPDAQVEASPG